MRRAPRLILAAGLAAAALVTSAPEAGADGVGHAGACGSDPGGLTINVMSDSPTVTRCLTNADISSMSAEAPSSKYYYVRYSSSGDSTEEPLAGRYPVDEILQTVVDPGKVRYTAVAAPGKSDSAYLSADTDDFGEDPSAAGYPFGQGPPVFVTTSTPGRPSQIIGYFRPQRGAVAADNPDVNGPDARDTSAGMQLNIHLTGHYLQPVLLAKRTTVAAGQSAQFTITPPDDPDQNEHLSYNVDYGDGSASANPRNGYRHAYSTPGTYDVYAEVTGTDGSSGSSNHVQITVTGAVAPTSSAPTTGGSTNANGGVHNPTVGPVRGSGTHTGGAPVITAAPQPGAPGASARPGGLSSAPGAGTVASRSPRAPSSGSGSAAPAASGPARPTQSRPAASERGAIVGYVLADAGAAPAADAASSRPAAAPAERGSRHAGDLGLRITVGTLAVLGVLGLLALGAGAELRRPRSGAGPALRRWQAGRRAR